MAARESNPGPSPWRFQGQTAIADATERARIFAHGNGLASDDQARLCIVVEELVANLYEHGGVTFEQHIELLLAAGKEGIRLVLIDPGSPFDARNFSGRQRRASAGAGAGTHLVRAWTEFVDYSVEKGRNRLELLFPKQRLATFLE